MMTDILVTDPPDPDCYICDGRGVVGGCGKLSCKHMHTYSFCRCVNERTVEVTDDDIETQTPWKMHDWNLGKGGADDFVVQWRVKGEYRR